LFIKIFIGQTLLIGAVALMAFSKKPKKADDLIKIE
jgi:hypothetical protein